MELTKESLGELLTRLPVLDRDAVRTDPEELARVARDRLEILTGEPVHDIGDVMARLGIMVFSVDMGDDDADAATVLLETGAVSVVNARMRTGRRRLSAAHELGHALLADEYTVDRGLGGSKSRVESRLDRFARAFLLPQEGLVSRWVDRRKRSLREAAVRTASEYRVDMATLARRLTELNLVDAGEARVVRGYRTTGEEIEEFGLVNANELAAGFLPHEFRDAVHRLYLDDLLGAERAVELLQNTCTVGDLPEPPPVDDALLQELVPW